MVEAKSRFLEMEVEGLFADAAELGQPSFGEAPEALDAVDVVELPGKLVLAMLDPEVLVVVSRAE